MKQGSKEWLAHRKEHWNSSEAGAAMGVNPWSPRNPSELYDLKTGFLEVKDNPAMQRGRELEPEARAAAEGVAGVQFTPSVVTKGKFSASLDGSDFDQSVAVEIKCPFRADSKLFTLNTPGEIKVEAPHYWWQMVHQYYCAGFDMIYFYVYGFNKDNWVLIDSGLLDKDVPQLLEAWEAFAKAIKEEKRPDGMEERTDLEYYNRVQAYIDAKCKAEAAKKEFDEARQALIDTCNGNTKGFGLEIKQVTRKGAIDYSKVPTLKDMDLENYRKNETVYWSIK